MNDKLKFDEYFFKSNAKVLFSKITLSLLSLMLLNSCGGKYQSPAAETEKSKNCITVDKFNEDEIVYSGGKLPGRLNYSDVRNSLNSVCMSCHMAPAHSGGFTYIDSYKGEMRTIAGQTEFFPGFYEVAEKMHEYLFHPDDNKRMPPLDRRKDHPEIFFRIGDKLQAWIKAGKPNGSFDVGSDGKNSEKSINGNAGSPSVGKSNLNLPRQRRDELGECIPKAEVVGSDFWKDRKFAVMSSLPEDLSDTDLFALDSYELAKKGTVAYNVEYPLWADNADKGRWIHLPMKLNGLKLERDAIQFDADKKQFIVPENTRLYKSFYKKFLGADEKYHFRRIETRLIVVRYPYEKSLVGSYKWDETEQTAKLIETPYRDGSPFKDTIYQVTVDEIKNKTRDYPIPGRQRCMNCHMGGIEGGPVLGITPLQLNRRIEGHPASGRDGRVTGSELSQVQRLIDYGFISGIQSQEDLPKLENQISGYQPNEFELKAQGYFVGNCSHCHNQQGLAFTPENKTNLGLFAGSIFAFNTKMQSTQISGRYLVNKDGDLDQSHIWHKVADPSTQLGMTNQMPMDTPGAPDCKVLRVVGKWIRSFESLQAANEFEPLCKKSNEAKWIDQDFTVVKSDFYIPKRNDWKDPEVGMPEKYRGLEFDQKLTDILRQDVAVGFWNTKPNCKFPPKELKPEEIRPWMMRGAKPKRPFGEVYFTSPGSWFYRTSCLKCHGVGADGNSSLARSILNWSGGEVRVANFIGGMFGQNGENLKSFDLGGQNYAPAYFIWMAMEGTRVRFPAELSGYLGKHGGQMLNQLREKCLSQVALEKRSNLNFMDHEVFNKICFANNLSKDSPELQFNEATGDPMNPVALEQWLNRAAYNIGYGIFDFLQEASQGRWRLGNDQCELIPAIPVETKLPVPVLPIVTPEPTIMPSAVPSPTQSPVPKEN
jgi:cytochrome c553